MEEGKSPQPRLRAGTLASDAKAGGGLPRKPSSASLQRRLPHPQFELN